jgi:HSP20 family protein
VVIARWSPFPELDLIERRMRRMLEDAGIAPAPLPAADVYETDGEYVVELEVAGFEENELAIKVTDHTLSVKGERTQEKEKKEKTYRRHERLEKSFERRFALPAEANLDAVKADFKKGVLEIHAPKAQGAKPREVKIEKGS